MSPQAHRRSGGIWDWSGDETLTWSGGQVYKACKVSVVEVENRES